jgi:hypothetical protein
MRNPARSLLILEIVICFLPCSAVLLAGVIMFPKELLLFQRPLGFDGPLRLVLSVPCGLIGLWTLYRVVSALLDGKQSIEHPARTLGCVVLGSLPLTLEFAATLSYEGEYGTRWPEFIAMICLPLFATAHILYLSRHLFIAGFRDHKCG